jgi:hypothetical protein
VFGKTSGRLFMPFQSDAPSATEVLHHHNAFQLLTSQSGKSTATNFLLRTHCVNITIDLK